MAEDIVTIRGRPALKGVSRKKSTGSRTSFTLEQKNAILEKLKELDPMEFVKVNWPKLSHKAMVSRSKLLMSWRSEKQKTPTKFQGSQRARKQRPLGAETVLSKDAESEIFTWFKSMRTEGIPVSGELLRKMARCVAAAENVGIFSASSPWLHGFMKRHNLAIRKSGNQGQVTPHDAQQRAMAFGAQVEAKMKEIGATEVWNADETPVFFDMVPKYSLENKGAKTVWIRGNGLEKRRVSVLLLGSSRGEKRRPFVVFKEVPSRNTSTQLENIMHHYGFGSQVWSKIAQKVVETGIDVRANHSGWLTSSNMCEWLDIHFQSVPGPTLLVLDQFSCHKSDQMMAKCKQLNITIMLVPSGCTCTAQPADVAWNRPFKNKIRELWVAKMICELSSCGKKLWHPSRDNVLEWISSSWNDLSEQVVVSGFRGARMLEEATKFEAQVHDLVTKLQQCKLYDVELIQECEIVEQVDPGTNQ